MSNPFDFGNIAVCEKCGVTIPAVEAQVIPRIIYQGGERGVAEAIRTNLVVCPRCLEAVVRKNQLFEFRHWALLGGVAAMTVLVLLILFLLS